jgi:hypothetical protein
LNRIKKAEEELLARARAVARRIAERVRKALGEGAQTDPPNDTPRG